MKKYKTKNGQEVIIRLPHANEAKQLLDLKLSYIEESGTIPLELAEYKNTEEKEAALIRKYQDNKNSILLVATVDSILVGNIDLTGNERKKMFHTGMIGMGISFQFRNQGIGTFLIKEVLDWAREESPIEIIWLDVYSNNNLGLGLYKKMNFEISGVIENFFKHGDQYFDKVQMYQRI